MTNKNKKFSLLPAVLTGLYILVTGFALWLPFSPAADDPLWGLWAVLLTMPWSMFSMPLLDALNPALLDQGWGMATLIIGGLINAVLIYIITNGFINQFKRSTL